MLKALIELGDCRLVRNIDSADSSPKIFNTSKCTLFFPLTTHSVTFQDVTMCGHFAEIIINENDNNEKWMTLGIWSLFISHETSSLFELQSLVFLYTIRLNYRIRQCLCLSCSEISTYFSSEGQDSSFLKVTKRQNNIIALGRPLQSLL